MWRYGWDGHDRLVRCDNPDGETWFYGYDPFGRRLTKVRKLSDRELSWTAQRHPGLVPASVRGGTQLWTWPAAPAGSGEPGDGRPPVVGVQFTWDGDVVAEEAPLRLDGAADWDAATRWHFEPGGFVPLAKQTAGGELLAIVTDHLGTPREMFDEAGGLRWAASYTTWGVVRGVRGAPPDAANDGRRAVYPRGEARGSLAVAPTREEAQYECPIRFQGQWEDQETELYLNRHRNYDARSGSYTSFDPIGLLGGTRPYGYVSNPNLEVDPFGLQAAPGGGFAFTQTTASPWFSKGGKFDGQTISDVASQLRKGSLKPSDVPVEVITVRGKKLIVNTRSSLALRQAGIDPSQWKIIDKTGDIGVEGDMAGRLSRNGLGDTGTDTLRITGSGGKASTYFGSGNAPPP